MKNFNASSISALLLMVTLSGLMACAPASQHDEKVTGATDSSEAIVGGTVVMPGSPLSKQVFMLYGKSSQGGFICTATLITRQHVLTAAHCVDNVKKMYAIFTIDAVATLRKGNLDNNPSVVSISSLRIYQGWVGSRGGRIGGTDAGDIAVLRLSKPAPEDFRVTKLHASALRKGQILLASGYGINSGTLGVGSGLLRETRIPVDEPILGRSEFNVDQTRGQGACSGDSGGPSFVVNSFGGLEQVGVTSRGDENCEIGGTYTLVPAYVDWINAAVISLSR